PSPTATSFPSGENATSQLDSAPSLFASFFAPVASSTVTSVRSAAVNATRVPSGDAASDQIGSSPEKLFSALPPASHTCTVASKLPDTSRPSRKKVTVSTSPRGPANARHDSVAVSHDSTKPPAPPTATRAPSGEN